MRFFEFVELDRLHKLPIETKTVRNDPSPILNLARYHDSAGFVGAYSVFADMPTALQPQIHFSADSR